MAAAEEKERQKALAAIAERKAVWLAIKDRNKEGLITTYFKEAAADPKHPAWEAVKTADAQSGWLMLQHAANSQCGVKAIDALIAAYPDALKVATEDGKLPIHLLAQGAQLKGDTEKGSLKLLADKEGGLISMIKGYPEAAKMADQSGMLPLHLAMKGPAPEPAVRELLAAHPVAVSQPCGEQSELPLHIAAEHKATAEAMDVLIEAHPKAASTRTARGNLPLHFAAAAGAVDVVEALLKAHRGACRVSNQAGMLPLQLACEEMAPVHGGHFGLRTLRTRYGGGFRLLGRRALSLVRTR
jgi:hypothetical protein